MIQKFITQNHIPTCLGVVDPNFNLSDNFLIKYRELIGFSAKRRPDLSVGAAQTIYNSVVVPTFTYFSIIDINLHCLQIELLERLHQRALNIIKCKNNQITINLTPFTNFMKRRGCTIAHNFIIDGWPHFFLY